MQFYVVKHNNNYNLSIFENILDDSILMDFNNKMHATLQLYTNWEKEKNREMHSSINLI